MSREDFFFTRFKREFVLATKVQHSACEFLVLEQTTKSMVEITTNFRERVLFSPYYATSKDMRMT